MSSQAYVVNVFTRMSEVTTAINTLAENGINAVWYDTGRSYPILVLDFEHFHKANALMNPSR